MSKITITKKMILNWNESMFDESDLRNWSTGYCYDSIVEYFKSLGHDGYEFSHYQRIDSKEVVDAIINHDVTVLEEFEASESGAWFNILCGHLLTNMGDDHCRAVFENYDQLLNASEVVIENEYVEHLNVTFHDRIFFVDFKKFDGSENYFNQRMCTTCFGMKELRINHRLIDAKDWTKFGFACDMGCWC